MQSNNTLFMINNTYNNIQLNYITSALIDGGFNCQGCIPYGVTKDNIVEQRYSIVFQFILSDYVQPFELLQDNKAFVLFSNQNWYLFWYWPTYFQIKNH